MSSVKIPVSADASRAISEMERFTSAIRKTGQEGRKFAELDFSHPEMKDFADRMAEAQRRFDEMVKAGRGATADKLRQGVGGQKYGDVLGWWHHLPKDPKLQDPRLRERHMTNVMNGVFAGTPMQPTMPGGESPSGKPQGGGGLPGAIGGSISSLLRFALPLVGLAKVGSMAMEGVSSATDEATETSMLRRSMGALTTDFETFRDQVRQAGDGLGVTYQETVRLARAFTSASGQTNEKAAFGNTRQAIDFARSIGMDPAQAVGRFGRAQWLQTGGKTADAKELAGLFSQAIAAGGMFSKADEVMDAINNWVASSERVMVDAPNTRDFAAMQAAMNASNRPGLQGQAGAAMLNQMDNAIRSGGGAGEAGKNFLYRIMSGAGVRDPFEMSYKLEEGAFSKMDDGRTMIQAVQEALQKQYANPMMRASAGARMLGISMHQYEAFEKLTPADLNASGKRIEGLGLDPDKIGSGSRLEIALLEQMQSDDLKKYRDQLVKSRGGELTREQGASLATDDSEALRSALIGVVASIGPEKDIGRRTLDATVEIKNQVTRLADGLLEPIETVKSTVGEGVGDINDVVESIYDAVTNRSMAPIEELRKKRSAQLYAALAGKPAPSGEDGYNQALDDNKRRETLARRRESGVVEERNQRIDAWNATMRPNRIQPGAVPSAMVPNSAPVEVKGTVEARFTLENQKGEPIARKDASAPLQQPSSAR